MAHGCRTFEYFQQLTGNEVETTVNDSPGPKAESVYYFFFAEIFFYTNYYCIYCLYSAGHNDFDAGKSITRAIRKGGP